MSAQPIPTPQPPKDPICKTPLSVFERLLEFCNFTQLKCFGHILNETTKDKNRTWVSVKASTFAEIARTTEEWAQCAVDSLIESKLLEIQYVDGHPNRPRYRIAADLIAETKAEKIRGKCKECQWIGMFSTEFIPMPRKFYTVLMPALDHATFMCVAVVARYTHHWNGERGLWVEPCELNMHDFRLTGLEPGQIKNGLDKGVELGLIRRTNRAGKASIFASCPENWHSIQKRPLREITPPVRGAKDQAKQPSEPAAKTPIKPAETPTIESRHFRSGVCPKCERVVEVEPVEADLLMPEVLPAVNEPPKQPPRAAPKAERKPMNRQDEATEVLKGWWKSGAI